MARKFSGFTNGLTNQSPADTLVGLDLSLAANAQNTYWTLNNLFSVITRNITDGAIRFQGFAAPSVSAAGQGSIYFDGTLFQVSQNGGAYAALGVGGGISGAVSDNLIRANSATTGTDSGIVSTQAANSVSSRKNVSDYATLAAAVAAIGSSTVTTLVIAVSTAVTSNLTITKNITLQFTNSGSLSIANGAIVNHYGGIDAAPNQQIFFRTGTGRIIFGGADCTNGATQSQMIPASTSAQIPAFYPQWWGVKGDWQNGPPSTDDTDAWQALLNVIPNDCQILLTPNLICKITAKLSLNNRRGVALRGVAGGGSVGATAEPVPTFMWLGANGGTMLELGRCRNCVFENIYFSGAVINGSGNGADIGIYLNNGGGTAGDISSNNTFDRCTVWGNSSRDTFVGVWIGNAANGNNDEFHTFRDCDFRASLYDDPNRVGGIPGTAVYLAHSNVKKISFERCQFGQSRYCLSLTSGSFSCVNSSFNYSMVAFKMDGWSDFVFINEIDSEGITQLFKAGPGSSSPLWIGNGRYSRLDTQNDVGTASNPFIDFSTGGIVATIVNNFFGEWYQNTSDEWYNNRRYLLNGSVSATVNWLNNTTSNYRLDFLYTNFLTIGKVNFENRQFFGRPASSDSAGAVGAQSTGILRKLVTVQQESDVIGGNFGRYASAQNNLVVGDGQLEAQYLSTPNIPYLRVIGTTGATPYNISIIATDAAGRRSLRSATNGVSTANATLTGSNYVQIDWQAVPSAVSYLILQTDPGSAGQFRVIATVAAPTTTYNLVANPVGAFTYTNPTYNETAQIFRRGQVADVVTITFTDADTTPSVAQTNQFTATNTGATTITNFDDGVNGQTIWILFTNANTTLQHNATIKMRSGGNVTPATDTMYSFTRRSGVWYEN